MAPVGRMPERTRDRMAEAGVESGADCLNTLPAVEKRIAILISGRGSNMQAIVQRCAEQQWPARVVAVIANRADAAGLQFAADHGIATAVVDHQRYLAREQ